MRPSTETSLLLRAPHDQWQYIPGIQRLVEVISNASEYWTCLSPSKHPRNAVQGWNSKHKRTCRTCVSPSTFQESSGWLKLLPSLDILDMSGTFETRQEFSGWLNAWVPSNIQDMSVTFETSQESSGWVNAQETLNMLEIPVTFDKSHRNSVAG